MDDLIREAIIEANKLGARGIQVVGFIWPQSATESKSIKLITQQPKLATASQKQWFEE